MARGIGTDTRTSCVRGTSSPTTSTRTGSVMQRLPTSGSRSYSAPFITRAPENRESGANTSASPGIRGDRIAVMLVHPWDAPNNDDEWRAVLHKFDFGQLIAPGGPDRDLPIVVPTHFIFDGEHTVELHLDRANPVWRAITERPRALMAVVADYV